MEKNSLKFSIPHSLPQTRIQIKTPYLQTPKSMDHSRLLLEKRIADLRPQIAAAKSDLDALESQYQTSVQEFRDLEKELDELVEEEREKDRYYEAKMEEMEEFRERVRGRLSGVRSEVECIRGSVSQLRSTLNSLQDNDGYQNNSEIAIAEKSKSDLLATKEELDKSLASSYELKLLLQKQLQKVLISRGRDHHIRDT